MSTAVPLQPLKVRVETAVNQGKALYNREPGGIAMGRMAVVGALGDRTMIVMPGGHDRTERSTLKARVEIDWLASYLTSNGYDVAFLQRHIIRVSHHSGI